MAAADNSLFWPAELRRCETPIAFRDFSNSHRLHRLLQIEVDANSQRWIRPLRISRSAYRRRFDSMKEARV
jgi:hypothetical protein